MYFVFLLIVVATGWLSISKVTENNTNQDSPFISGSRRIGANIRMARRIGANIRMVIVSAVFFFLGLQFSLLTRLFQTDCDGSRLTDHVATEYSKAWAPDEIGKFMARQYQEEIRRPSYLRAREEESREGHMKEDSSFCHRWDPSVANNRSLQPFDVWLTHHPTWVVSNETDEKFCVEPGNKHDHPHIRRQLQFYSNQFHSSCDRVHIRTMYSSGWGADFSNIQAGLVYALNNRIPLIMQDSGKPWHYTANKNDSSALTCDEGDTTCYFLPYHDCKTSSQKYWEGQKEIGKAELVVNGDLLDEAGIDQELGQEAYQFMTRKMLWFRRAVFDYKQTFKKANNIAADSDCTVFHVRRGDVVLHPGGYARRYFPVAEYVKHMNSSKLSNPNHYIFLLTDDAGAINEAHEFFPDMNIKHFDRPRHKGSNKGTVWENQTPSRDPALEVIVMVATFELVQECSSIVWSASNFANYMYNQMLLVNPRVESYRVDDDGTPIYSSAYNNTESDLENYLNELRRNISSGISII